MTAIRDVKTQGIKYAGSKLRLIPYILQMLSELKDVDSVLDGFSGTTRVAQAFAKSGYSTTANDISVWSEVFATCYLKSTQSNRYYQQLIDHLNQLEGCDGWFTEHYGGERDVVKRPFQAKNTRKLDAIRIEIERLQLPWEDKCVLLTSLILALDKVDSTLGHYVAYLATWSKRSYNDLWMKLPLRFHHEGNNRVIRADVFDTVSQNEFDLVYFDPPYGSNNERMPPSRVRYNAYYHIWTTVIQNDQPLIFGKANRREDSRDYFGASVFEEFRKDEQGQSIAVKALEDLISKTRSRYILLSYSSGGRTTRSELNDMLHANGKLLKAVEVDYRHNVMASMRSTNAWVNSDGRHLEYLFLLQK